MKPDLLERLQTGVVIGDGAMGTLLYERGLPLDRCCEELVLTDPEMVRRIHEDYLAAGAQVIETNSFAANRARLARRGLEERAAEINRKAAALAAGAAQRAAALTAGSVGPLGVPLEEARAQGLDPAAVFREQIGALLEGGADFILLETFSDLEEILIALAAAREAGRVPVAASMSFTEDGVTHRGAPIEKAFAALRTAGAAVVGANCCVGPRALGALFQKHAAAFPDIPWSAFPNAGRPEFFEGRYFYPTAPAYFAERGAELARLGARLIGGCCGTRPEHIAALRAALEAVRGPGGLQLPPPVAAPGRAVIVEEPAPAARPVPAAKPPLPTLPELVRQRTVVVTEFDSPKTLLLEKMLAAARALKEAGTDFLTVADNSLAILRTNCVIASHLVERETGLRTIVHLACRDRNLIGTQSELMGMDALGLAHVLALTGDPSKVGDTPGATSVYDLNSVSLLEGIRAMNEGRTFGGRELKRPARFVAGCSFNPNVKNLEVQVKRLERKVAAGAQFVMTQPIFDPAQAQVVRDATARFGIPVLVGVMPLLNARNTDFLHNEVPGIVIPDAVRERMRGKEGEAGFAEGLAVARELAREVLAHFGAIYLITPLVRYEATAALSAGIRKGRI